ncbi:unnamed protein product [Schistosoma mattheei]|uniref:Uncharacterized protein n=1 Tax=Schistosoma mattheei TaxID=31246 RepID=A0A183P7S2_9TREM|nr:unnamed protein product [Schistosoma mattheei]
MNSNLQTVGSISATAKILLQRFSLNKKIFHFHLQEQLRALPGLIRTVIIQQHLAYQKLVTTTTPGTTSSINQPMTLKFEEHKS